MGELTKGVLSRMDAHERDAYAAARSLLSRMERGVAELEQDTALYAKTSDIQDLMPHQRARVQQAHAALTDLIFRLNAKYKGRS